MREVETTGAASPVPDGERLETWAVAAIAPGWRPSPGEAELLPVPGRLELFGGGFVFRADDAVDRRTGERLVGMVPAASVREAGPLSPGTHITPTELAGLWMPRMMRRLRCPGFAVRTSDGDWAFDCPAGVRRARRVSELYAR
jgi:hypothetical protein